MKTIGRKLFPNSARTFPNKRSAAIVDDALKLHGARISVTVHNAYRSFLFQGSKSDVCIAADRIVRLKEDGIECWIDTHLAKLTVRKRRRGDRPPYGAFLCELPKRVLKSLPVLVEYDPRGRLVGVTIFRSSPRQRKRQRVVRPARKRAADRRRSA